MCGKVCIKGSDLFRHYPTHGVRAPNGQLLCDSCSFTTPRAKDLEEHMKGHYRLTKLKESHMWARCGLCQKKLHRSRLFQHKRQAHGQWMAESVARFTHTCQYCDKTFQTSRSLAIHSQRHHTGSGQGSEARSEVSTESRSEVSPVIVIKPEAEGVVDSVGSVSVLEQPDTQMYYDASEPSPPPAKTGRYDRDPEGYSCKYCGKNFPFKTRLAQHVRVHETTPRRSKRAKSSARRGKQRCEVCKKTFKSAGYLEQHMLLHTGQKPFVCGCGAAFSLLQSLQAHHRRKCTGSQVNKGEGSQVNKGEGSQINKGEGSQVNKGAGSQVNKGAGSQVNKGEGSQVNKGEGSQVNKGEGSNVSEVEVNGSDKNGFVDKETSEDPGDKRSSTDSTVNDVTTTDSSTTTNTATHNP